MAVIIGDEIKICGHCDCVIGSIVNIIVAWYVTNTIINTRRTASTCSVVSLSIARPSLLCEINESEKLRKMSRNCNFSTFVNVARDETT